MKRIWALATVCLLVLPAVAVAADEQAGHRHATSAEFFVAGSNGYTIEVNAERGMVGILAAKEGAPRASFGPGEGNLSPGGTNFSATSFTVSPDEGNRAFGMYRTAAIPGLAPPAGIGADFGALGQISVAFVPSGEVRVRRFPKHTKTSKCHAPRRIVRQLGTFTGTIHFAGEGGYTAVDVTSAPGSVGTSPHRSCTSKSARPWPRIAAAAPDSAMLSASSSSEGTVFSANVGGATPGASFFAMAFEEAGAVQISRVAVASAPSSSFLFDSPLDPRARSSARVEPPPPFSGYGSFRRAPESPPRWTGTLSVAFPGLEAPLTGPAFNRAHLMPGMEVPR